MDIDPNSFLKEAEKRLRRMYRSIASGAKSSETERATITGFFQAGIFLKLTTTSKCNEIVSRVHLEEFGKTIAERKADKREKLLLDDEPDYSKYETPTHLRRQPSN